MFPTKNLCAFLRPSILINKSSYFPLFINHIMKKDYGTNIKSIPKRLQRPYNFSSCKLVYKNIDERSPYQYDESDEIETEKQVVHEKISYMKQIPYDEQYECHDFIKDKQPRR
jgi:hypothetical protein